MPFDACLLLAFRCKDKDARRHVKQGGKDVRSRVCRAECSTMNPSIIVRCQKSKQTYGKICCLATRANRWSCSVTGKKKGGESVLYHSHPKIQEHFYTNIEYNMSLYFGTEWQTNTYQVTNTFNIEYTQGTYIRSKWSKRVRSVRKLSDLGAPL